MSDRKTSQVSSARGDVTFNVGSKLYQFSLYIASTCIFLAQRVSKFTTLWSLEWPTDKLGLRKRPLEKEMGIQGKVRKWK